MLISRRHILWSTGTVAVAVRIFFFTLVQCSFFRFYHMVPGLDMQTLLRFSEWGSADAASLPFLTPHRVLIFLLWKCHGNEHVVQWIFAVQAVFGVLSVLAIADILLMLTGKRRVALVTAVLWAFYLPELIFEHSVLQDSLSTALILLALWGTLRARKAHFAPAPTMISALLWGCALLGRPTAILLAGAVILLVLCYLKRKKILKRSAYFIIPLLLILGAAGIFNFTFRHTFSPFFDVMPYTMRYDVQISAPGKAPSFWRTAGHAVCRMPKLLSCRERAENQNSAFWREKLPDLNVFPREIFLPPFATAGMLLLLLAGSLKRKEMVIWYPILLLALPLCAREPVNRYRLILSPYLLMAAALGYSVWLTLKNKFHCYTAMILALSSGFLIALFTTPRENEVRAEDYHAWALALENSGRADVPEILNAYYDFWRSTNFGGWRGFRAVSVKALKYRNYELADAVVVQAKLTGKVDPSIIHFFAGVRLVDNNDSDGVLREFSMVDPSRLPAENRAVFFKVRADALRISNLLHNRQKGVILK